MTAVEALSLVRKRLRAAHIESAPQEARLILCHVLDVSSAQLYTERERKLSEAQDAHFRAILQRRARREPLAYILNTCEFYGHEFYVDPRVLIPRPETELLVDLAIQSVTSHKGDGVVSVADIGTGSGAIAVSLALGLHRSRVYATDTSLAALQVAWINVRRYGLEDRIALVQGNLVEAVSEPVDVIVANLPYVSDRELGTLAVEIAAFEPRVALYGGPDGLEQIRGLLEGARTKLKPGAEILLEIGQGQARPTREAAARSLPGATINIVPDPAGIERVVHAVLQP